MKLEQIMKKSWQKARKLFYFPSLPDPKIVDDAKETKSAGISNISKQVFINRQFIEHEHQKGLTYEEILTGLLIHEIGHHMICPFDLYRMFNINITASKVDQAIANEASGFYIDLVVNLELMLNKDVKELTKLALAKETDFDIHKLERAFYQAVTGIDTGFELPEHLEINLKRLKSIDFFDYANEERNVRKLARIIKEVLANDEKYQKYKQQNPEQGKTIPNPLRDSLSFNPQSFTKNEIDRALRKLALEKNKEDFEKVMKNYNLDQILDQAPGEPQKNQPEIGTGGQGKEQGTSTLFYYQKLAENYLLKIRKKQLKQNGSLYPYSHKPFEIDDSPQDIDVFNSFGKPFIPGLGKTWIKKEGETYGHQEDVPNAIICIDSSASMTDPDKSLSYAVLGSICAANTYLQNQRKVGIFNFSNEAVVSPFSTDKKQIHKDILNYQGCGTSYGPEEQAQLEELIKSSDQETDIVVVTDLGISGREEFFGFLHNNKKRNRVTILYIGSEDNEIKELQKKYQDDNFNIYVLDSQEKIPQIVIGEVNKSIK